ncbi:hypothetical protein TOPH_04663 [Tolypocladium ophioglossoides CBS 100239]|uniref:DUF2293 domain-containing protein n=1 Tax=Tolypocladium ophioglossoides (strain CBS 100239) TaxID=1163406 RepID=A0A0L0N9M8_TOLOC|nr:hypothetical protein TOPH_04663 [Tolypocladium ophioglossoides CBS 100239]
MAPEPIVSQGTPMPHGYGFLKKGNPFMTALCRRKSRASGETLYVVHSQRVPVGLRAPKWILDEVVAEECETRAKRQAAVEKRDGDTEEEFKRAIQRLFPRIPSEEVAKILKRALQKRSGRVGRTGKLDLDSKVRLAVGAHVRHCHTPYDRIINKNKDKVESRKAVHDEISRVLQSWGGSPVRGMKAKSSKKRVARQAARGRDRGSAQRVKQIGLPLVLGTSNSGNTRPSTTRHLEPQRKPSPGMAREHEIIEIIDSDEEFANDSSSDGSWEPSDDEDGQADEDLDVIVIEDSDDD